MEATKLVIGVISLIVGIVMIFYIVAALAPTITSAANNMSASGLPLASLFSSSGVILTILIIGVFLAVLIMVFKLMQHK